MPRIAREISVSDVYHVIFRGNDRQDMFYDDHDRNVFLEYIRKTKDKYKYELYSYCLMDNHVHLVIRAKKEIFSLSMQSLAIRYALYFNKKFNRKGHLFENKFVSKKIENKEYFIHVCKYIHRNPEKANICKTENYKWSSFKEYVEKEKNINKTVLLHYFNDDLQDFINYTLENNDKEELAKVSDFEIISKISDDELNDIIMKKYKLSSASDVSLLGLKERNTILSELKEIEGINLTQISRVTKVSRYYIKKLN